MHIDVITSPSIGSDKLFVRICPFFLSRVGLLYVLQVHTASINHGQRKSNRISYTTCIANGFVANYQLAFFTPGRLPYIACILKLY